MYNRHVSLRSLNSAASVLLLALAFACGGESGGADAGSDSDGPDLGAMDPGRGVGDAGPADAGPDAAPDSGMDAGPDAGPDAGVDAGPALVDLHVSLELVRGGAGSVSSVPGSIDCGASCDATYASGTMVTLTATPGAGSEHLGWTTSDGSCAALGDCVVMLSESRTVTAIFGVPLPTFDLHVSTESVRGGTGVVTSLPAGIDCGVSCDATYDEGTMVTLTATPDAGFEHTGWTTDDGSCASLGDCVVTLSESRTVTASFMGSPPVYLSLTDHDPDIRIRWDRLGADLSAAFGGARSDTAIAPGSGVYYVEGRRITFEVAPFGIAVASGLLDLNDASCGATDQSFGINVPGGIAYDSAWVGGFEAEPNEYYGLVVDYRGAFPTVYLILEDMSPGTGFIEPQVRFVQPMPAVTTDLYFMVCGMRAVMGAEMEVNPGNDTTNFPFFYDVDGLLRAAGHTTVADELVMGWGGTYAGPADDSPVVTTSADVTVTLGDSVTVTASAADTEDGVLDAAIQWDLETSAYFDARQTGAGTSFMFTPADIGVHPVRAWVADSIGQVGESTINVTVNGSVTQYDPVVLTPDALAMGTGVELRADGLAARWTGFGKYGMRANQGIYGQFWYFELTRLVDPVNMGGGVVVNYGSLDPYGWPDTPQSMSVNVVGGTWRNLIPRVNGILPGPASNYTSYGFAVDYRGARPTVYVIANDAVVDTIVMDDVTTPLYPMLYGNPTGFTVPGEFDEAINFGATAFANDAITALTADGVDLTGFGLGWGDVNIP